mgnify:CR=1 FL=1
MYDKQYEVGKVCTLVKIFETICFGVQKATNYIYLFQIRRDSKTGNELNFTTG